MRPDVFIGQIADATQFRNAFGDPVGELRKGFRRADADAGRDADPLPDGRAQVPRVRRKIATVDPERSRKLSSME